MGSSNVILSVLCLFIITFSSTNITVARVRYEPSIVDSPRVTVPGDTSSIPDSPRVTVVDANSPTATPTADTNCPTTPTADTNCPTTTPTTDSNCATATTPTADTNCPTTTPTPTIDTNCPTAATPTTDTNCPTTAPTPTIDPNFPTATTTTDTNCPTTTPTPTIDTNCPTAATPTTDTNCPTATTPTTDTNCPTGGTAPTTDTVTMVEISEDDSAYNLPIIHGVASQMGPPPPRPPRSGQVHGPSAGTGSIAGSSTPASEPSHACVAGKTLANNPNAGVKRSKVWDHYDMFRALNLEIFASLFSHYLSVIIYAGSAS
ncbi:cell wall protein DAN4-like [Papaver somniferum]|uniref:cell wall protein DAN4-like n=1 Tax=Papaver somniferum TaxID=3469 RepID=UPI000E6FE50E|nr:cell wall protein DAN4-like [Papaver somniferum]